MSAHVLMILLKDLRKSGKMRGNSPILAFYRFSHLD